MNKEEIEIKKLCNKFVNNISKQNNTNALANLEKILKQKISKRIKTVLEENDK